MATCKKCGAETLLIEWRPNLLEIEVNDFCGYATKTNICDKCETVEIEGCLKGLMEGYEFSGFCSLSDFCRMF